jgi:hypothetical protein
MSMVSVMFVVSMVSSLLLHGSTILTETSLHPLPSLDALHVVEHLHAVDSAVVVGVTLLHGLHDLLLVVGRSLAHREGEISVGLEELLTLEAAGLVSVIFLENLLNALLKFLVMVVIPSS